MHRLSHVLVSILSIVGVNAGSAVLDLLPHNYDEVVLKSGKPALVEFFAPWCGHCKNLAPVYEELAQNFAFASDKVSIAKVDADEHKKLGKRFNVQGFPTLKWFDGKSDTPEDYNGGRDLDSLSSFITSKTGIKPKTKRSMPSKVQDLDDKSFKTEIGGDKDVLVAFTAPWCGRELSNIGVIPDFWLTTPDCKKLAPVWETVANDFASEPTVLVAKVDAEAPNAKATAQEQGVTSYPTIKYFPKGSTTPQMYEGGRSEEDFVAFLNKHAGTHRTVGGLLDTKAGTVEALDTLVSKIAGGETVASVMQEVQKAAKDLKDKSGEYYLKVLKKLEQNEGYVEKELGRVQGLLKKGGLAPEKVDELTIRSNILRKFVRRDNKDEL